MTTTVTVHANHGWPVDVIQLPVGQSLPGWAQRVAPGETREFSVHSGADLRIHEVQPGETGRVNGTAVPLTHTGLPVAGYQPQTADKVARVNAMKTREERMLRILDDLKDDPEIDQRWLAIGRTGLEQAFMAVNRAIFRPARVDLDE